VWYGIDVASLDGVDAGGGRPLAQLVDQAVHGICSPDCYNLDTAVGEIPRVPSQLELPSMLQNEPAKTDTLHDAVNVCLQRTSLHSTTSEAIIPDAANDGQLDSRD
jgi:hypothetical protein